jgi:hypothetical protein
MKNEKQKLRMQVKKLEKEAAIKMSGYILASFGLVAGLAWNEAIKAYIEIWFPSSGENASAKLIYAIVISTIVILISIGVSMAISKIKEY